MVRPRKTQTPQTPGLEAGAAYGEVSDSLEAQKAIPHYRMFQSGRSV